MNLKVIKKEDLDFHIGDMARHCSKVIDGVMTTIYRDVSGQIDIVVIDGTGDNLILAM